MITKEKAIACVEYVRREYTDMEPKPGCFLEILEALDFVEAIIQAEKDEAPPQ